MLVMMMPCSAYKTGQTDWPDRLGRQPQMDRGAGSTGSTHTRDDGSSWFKSGLTQAPRLVSVLFCGNCHAWQQLKLDQLASPLIG